MGVRPLPDGAPRGFQVSLSAAVAWAAKGDQTAPT